MSDAGSSTALKATRSWLQSQGLDALIVPMADAFQSEWVPEHSKRLAWLTGFRGSRALAVVGLDSAVVYLPGLYELQGKAQIDAEQFQLEIVAGMPDNISGFVKALPAGAKIACDARLVTPREAKAFERQVAAADARMHWLTENPIDALWADRPAATDKPVFVYPTEVAGESSADKRRRVGQSIAEAGADCAVLSLSDSVCWLLNVRGHDGPITPFSLSYAVLRSDGRVDWFVEQEKLTDEVQAHVGAAVQTLPLEAFWTALAQEKGRVLIDEASLPYAAWQALDASSAQIVAGSDPCQRPKAAKNAVEVAGMRRTHLRDGAALSRYLCWLETQLRAGTKISELDGARRLTAFRAEDEQFFTESFPTISAAGAHAALPHYLPDEASNAAIRVDGCYLIDSGGQYRDGGTTDVTRTLWLIDASLRFREEYTRVLKGYLALERQRFPAGTKGIQLDVLARQYLWQAGKDYMHSTGHGVGAFLNVHEGPQRIGSGGEGAQLEAGNILSNEPGYYLEGEYGIRIENLLVIEELEVDGAEKAMFGFSAITLAPIDTRLIQRELMTDEEIRQLNEYHARVQRELSPLLDDETNAWLERRCAAI